MLLLIRLYKILFILNQAIRQYQSTALKKVGEKVAVKKTFNLSGTASSF